ncbi:BON domain-containing protein [Piscinibacter gummiphilus]|uniref:BON domain-containing protein n=1 Tax=Piscinibacter gummiphilus TaxID=946333 RepID=A0A1W6LDL4_9BURK|nr:BON domain-containing protein [Piscinibacter gummiphilus]ARN22317.1 hypothetical protein A4W93_21775 [Piscinibacter gummiphilus]ATU67011.1 transporter [Piscinibacter gummiphilus]GLS97889.1 hypothetical protein GCM10007918_51810 [Piscinibacter gummiphilus]
MVPLARVLVVILAAGSTSLPCHGEEPPTEQRNWFGDPFFQVSAQGPGCPLPRGPFRTAQQRDVQSHNRAERGTTCWLAGTCSRPNAFHYDQDIALAFRAQAARFPALFKGTALWVTVQGRIVFVEGCVTRAATVAALEDFTWTVPDVGHVIVRVRVGAKGEVPYPVLAAASGSDAGRRR